MPPELQKYENSHGYYLIFLLCPKCDLKLVPASFMDKDYIPNQHTPARPIVGLVSNGRVINRRLRASEVEVVANGLAPGHVNEVEILDS